MKKRFLSILVTAAMLLSLLPMAVYAEGEGGAPQEGVIQLKSQYFGDEVVGSYSDLADALEAAESSDDKFVAITADYTLTGNVTIPTDVYLDVGGSDGKNITFTVANGSKLTVSEGCKRLGVQATNGLKIEDGGIVFLEGGSSAAGSIHYENGRDGRTIEGKITAAEGKVILQAASRLWAGDKEEAVAKLSHINGMVTWATTFQSLPMDIKRVDLLKDVTDFLVSSSPELIIDLGGHTLTNLNKKNNSTIKINAYLNEPVVTIQNGTVKAYEGASNAYGAVEISGSDCTVNIAEDVVIDGGAYRYGVALLNNRSTLNVAGTVKSSNNFAITGNGNGESDDTKISIRASANISAENAPAIYHPQLGNLNIEGGTISGTAGVEIRSGTLQMTGGDITGRGEFSSVENENGATTSGVGIAVVQHATQHDLSVDISGGSVTGTKYGLYQADVQGNETDNVTMAVTGGNFAASGSDGDRAAVSSGTCSAFIFWGYFTSDPSAYLVVGKSLVTSDKAGYPYKVGENAVDVQTAVAAGEPVAKVPAGSSVTEDVVKTAAATEETKASLTAAATGLHNDPDVVGEKSAAETALTEDGVNISGETVTVVVQPYLDVEVTEIKADTSEKYMKVNISAKYNVVATTADAPGNIETGETGKNAVVLKAAQELENVTQPVTITLPLPSGFVTAIGDPVFVHHVKGDTTYVYKATVTVGNGAYFATFVNPHGFSEFVLKTEAAASIADGDDAVYYATLQDAVDAVKNDQTIKILKTSESAVVSRTVKFTVDRNSMTYTITLGSRCTDRDANDDVYDIIYTPSSGGGSSTTYAINIEKTSHGTVTASSKTAASGRTVTLTVKPDEGYVLDELTVTDAKGKNVKLTKKSSTSYTFEMPAGAVTVEAVFEKGVSQRPADAYTDVSENAWYYEAVDSVLTSGMMSGTSATTFAPNATLTRAMVVQTLWAAQGKPVVNYLMTYDDVSGSDWYAESIRWAASERIVSGYSDTQFGPNDPVTREQLMVMLYAYAKSEGKGFTGSWMFQLGYADTAQVSQWAYEAACWCTTNGVVSGKTGNLLDPQGTATRAEAAQMLVGLMEAIG